jgi:hypothetical protein
VQGTVSVTPQDQSVLSYNGTSLVAKAAGSTRVNITCGGCTQEFAVEVTQPSITDATIDAISDQTYTGNAITPGVTVRLGSKVLTQNVDYTVSYSNNTSIGTAYVTVSGRGNYTGTKTAYFRIAAPTVSNAVVTAIPDQTYTGSALYPLVYVYVNNTLLRENTDYTLAYTNNVNIGTASVAITGMGSYSGTKTVTFRILGPGMSAATIETIPDQLYTGSDIRPTVTVTLNNTTLKLNTDYTVSYSNNRNVGTATVTITGRGSYSGTKTTTFRILSKDISNTTVSSIGSQTYTGLEIYPDVTVKIGTVTLTKGVDYTLSYRNNIKPGTASITINGAGSYTGSKIVTFQITRLSLADATIKVANQTCNGKAKKPKVTVRLDGETLRSGDDYTCTYSNNKNPGKASVKVKGTGAYSGTRTVYFVILPKKMTLRSAEARTKAAYLTWKADSGVSGYELFRSTKKASGYRRIATINQVGASACTNTALSAGTYYYKIRSYVVVDGKKYYGAFSSVKRVKIK